VFFFLFSTNSFSVAGTWADHFSSDALGADWRGNRDYFRITDAALDGQSASPLAPSPLNLVEVGEGWTDYTIRCWMNVVAPNSRVCTKGALILRDNGKDGYVFALHEPTQTVEVYRLSNHEMLLSKPAAIELKKWYRVRAELQGPVMSFFVDDQLMGTVTDDRSLSGAVGVAVQDAEQVLFDDFTVTGPNIPGNVDGIAPPEFAPVERDGNQLLLRFLALPPYHYHVQYSASVPGYGWQTLTSFTAKVSSFEAVAVDQITNSYRFYRIEKVFCECR